MPFARRPVHPPSSESLDSLTLPPEHLGARSVEDLRPGQTVLVRTLVGPISFHQGTDGDLCIGLDVMAPTRLVGGSETPAEVAGQIAAAVTALAREEAGLECDPREGGATTVSLTLVSPEPMLADALAYALAVRARVLAMAGYEER
jgi:hypothetical protein